MLMQLSLVAGGGLVGACARFLALLGLKFFFPTFSFATLLVNIVGCFFIGISSAKFFVNPSLSPGNWIFFFNIGILGAFTTFSTFSLELLQMLHQAQWKLAFLNAFFHFTLTLLATYLGIKLSILFQN